MNFENLLKVPKKIKGASPQIHMIIVIMYIYMIVVTFWCFSMYDSCTLHLLGSVDIVSLFAYKK